MPATLSSNCTQRPYLSIESSKVNIYWRLVISRWWFALFILVILIFSLLIILIVLPVALGLACPLLRFSALGCLPSLRLRGCLALCRLARSCLALQLLPLPALLAKALQSGIQIGLSAPLLFLFLSLNSQSGFPLSLHSQEECLHVPSPLRWIFVRMQLQLQRTEAQPLRLVSLLGQVPQLQLQLLGTSPRPQLRHPLFVALLLVRLMLFCRLPSTRFLLLLHFNISLFGSTALRIWFDSVDIIVEAIGQILKVKHPGGGSRCTAAILAVTSITACHLHLYHI
mmetsp:Transcript_42684/g.75581  ORF Transcript_42684/g.75581 Transcript_42684/m.75581 type:complete len:283 (-) Transcript_42684:3-851(-)